MKNRMKRNFLVVTLITALSIILLIGGCSKKQPSISDVTVSEITTSTNDDDIELTFENTKEAEKPTAIEIGLEPID